MKTRHLLRSRILAGVLAAAAATAAGSTVANAQASPPAGCEGPRSDTWITVNIQGVRNGNGLMAVTLYPDDSGKFLIKHGSLYTGRYNATAGATRGCLFVPRPGVYAIAVYHDENASRKINRNALGLPQEGFGFSNNPSTFAGIPAFRSVRLNVPRPGLTTTIRLRYP